MSKNPVNTNGMKIMGFFLVLEGVIVVVLLLAKFVFNLF